MLFRSKFIDMDENGDGFISLEEFQKASETASPEVSVEGCGTCSSSDRNGCENHCHCHTSDWTCGTNGDGD